MKPKSTFHPDYMEVKIPIGQRLYGINKITGGIIHEMVLVRTNGKKYVEKLEDMFYWSAKNMRNAKWKLNNMIKESLANAEIEASEKEIEEQKQRDA